MDGVLVNQIGRKRWDLMGWTADGKELWEFLQPLKPTLLSQLMADVWDVSSREKRIWVDRELGDDVPLIVTHAERGKHPHCKAGDILIDDNARRHESGWIVAGGVFIHHKSAQQSINEMRSLLT